MGATDIKEAILTFFELNSFLLLFTSSFFLCFVSQVSEWDEKDFYQFETYIKSDELKKCHRLLRAALVNREIARYENKRTLPCVVRIFEIDHPPGVVMDTVSMSISFIWSEIESRHNLLLHPVALGREKLKGV